MKKTYTALLILGITFTACKKNNTEQLDANQLPPATETGANILACKVNGMAHIYSGVPIRLYMNGVNFDKVYIGPDEQSISVFASDSKYDDEISITISEPGWVIQVDKEYVFSKAKVVGQYNYGSIAECYTDSGSGSVIFSKYNDKIVAGKFFFKAYNKKSSHNRTDSVNITEGFFDISVAQ